MNETQHIRKDTRDIVRGAVVNLGGTLIRSLKFIFFIVLGRLYGPQWVGLFLLTLAAVDFLSNVAILGLDQAILTLAARRHAEADETGLYRLIGQAVAIGFVLSFGIVIILELMAPWMATVVFDKPEIIRPLRIMAWVLPFWAISAVLLSATRALRVMQYEIVVKSAVEPAVMLFLAVLFYYLKLGLTGMGLAVVCAAVAGSLTAIYCFSRMLSLRKLWHGLLIGAEKQHLFRFAIPIGFADVLNELLKRIDIFLVGRYLSADLLGIYGIAQEGAATIKKIRQAFNPIFIPVISATHQNKDNSGMSLQYQNVTRWILILDAAFLVIMFLAGRQVMTLFGAEFIAGATALAILSLATAINGIWGISELFILIDKPWINMVNSACAIVAAVILNMLLIPRYGIIGAASAVLILHAGLNTVRLIQTAILYKLHPFSWDHVKATLAFVLSLGAVWGIWKTLQLHGTSADLSAVFVCWILYFSLLVTFGLAPEEKSLMDIGRRRIGKILSLGESRHNDSEISRL